MLNCKTFSTNANVLFRLNFKGFSKKCKSFNLNILLRDADLINTLETECRLSKDVRFRVSPKRRYESSA